MVIVTTFQVAARYSNMIEKKKQLEINKIHIRLEAESGSLTGLRTTLKNSRLQPETSDIVKTWTERVLNNPAFRQCLLEICTKCHGSHVGGTLTKEYH